MGVTLSLRRIAWKSCWRLIPSRYPLVNLYARVAEPEDVKAVIQIEQLTNPRCRHEKGEMRVVPPHQMVKGPGSQYIMGPFYFPSSSRFSDGSYGVYYAAKSIRTAILETKYHREKFLRATQEKPTRINMRAVVARLRGSLHDIRGKRKRLRSLYSPTSYHHSQIFGVRLRLENSNGLIYKSVRDKKGECVAIFNPTVLSHAREERQLLYEWNGKMISNVYKIEEYFK